VAEYDIVMDTGPGYNTKRQESAANFMELLKSPLGEVIAKVGADLAVRTLDGPGMEALADRLAAANPLAQIDDKSDVPPQAQMMIKHLQQQVQQMGQQRALRHWVQAHRHIVVDRGQQGVDLDRLAGPGQRGDDRHHPLPP
jgi:hypothetical protein